VHKLSSQQGDWLCHLADILVTLLVLDIQGQRNNCTIYVENEKVSLYYSAYGSKHSSENEKALVEMLRALATYEENISNRELIAQNRTENLSQLQQPATASIGLGWLLSAARAATNGEIVGALLAAFAARGNLLFDMSQKPAVLSLTQTLAFLQAKPIQASIKTKGQVCYIRLRLSKAFF